VGITDKALVWTLVLVLWEYSRSSMVVSVIIKLYHWHSLAPQLGMVLTSSFLVIALKNANINID